MTDSIKFGKSASGLRLAREISDGPEEIATNREETTLHSAIARHRNCPKSLTNRCRGEVRAQAFELQSQKIDVGHFVIDGGIVLLDGVDLGN